MTCNRNETKINRTGSVKAGISILSSKAGSVAGAITANVARASDMATGAVGKAIAPTSNRLLTVIDRPTTIAANLLPVLATAAVYTQVKVATTGPRQRRRPAAAIAIGMREVPDMMECQKSLSRVKKGVGVAALIGGLGTSVMADLSEKPKGKRTLSQRKKRFLLGQQNVEVTFTKSKLTGWLNKRSSLLSGRNVVSSQGDMVHYGQSVWHRGTTMVKMPEGQRTITHVQKMGLPATSHYFDRALSDDEVASLVSGQAKAHQMGGYVGTIGAMENLAPSWTQVKRSMILTRLHWPTGEKTAARWSKTEPAKQVVMKPSPQTAKEKREKITN